jgi:hypothetical protein
VLRHPRPLLTVQLRSRLLDINDLGPPIGVETKSRAGRPTNQKEVANREQAKQSDKRTRGERVLPVGRFDPARLHVIDANVRVQAQRVKGVGKVPLQGFDATVKLQDAVLHLDPLNVGAAGGTLAARGTLDARQDGTLHSKVEAELRRLHLDQLVPTESPLAGSEALVNVNATRRRGGCAGCRGTPSGADTADRNRPGRGHALCAGVARGGRRQGAEERRQAGGDQGRDGGRALSRCIARQERSRGPASYLRQLVAPSTSGVTTRSAICRTPQCEWRQPVADDQDLLARINAINASAECNRWCGLEVLAAAPGAVELSMPWRKEAGQYAGFLHAAL